MRPILADAVDLARRALLELEPVAVGAYLGVIAEDESSATHRFEATLPGYRGWQWAVVVAAPPDADYATVSESALLPGPDALVAPEFVPWEQRIRPGDLAPGDLLAPPADDPRLVPGYVATGDPVVDEVAYEVGLGRTKVMSREGREEAAERWYAEYGPDSEMAKAAPGTCGTCGFYLPLAGSLRAAFGVCGNAMGADGHVVHVAYGCGAHSDTEVPSGSGSPLYEAYDDAAIEMISLEPERAESASRVAEQDSTEPAAEAGEHPAVEAASDGSGAVAEQAEEVSEGVSGVEGDAATDAVAETVAADVSAPEVLADTVTTPSEADESGAAVVAELPEEHSAEAAAEPTAVDGPASAGDHTAVPGESADDESGAVPIDTDSAEETAEQKPGATDSSRPAVDDESDPASVDPLTTSSASTQGIIGSTGDAHESSVAASQILVESSATEWPTTVSDSTESNTTGSNDAVSSATESGATEGQSVSVAADDVIEPGSVDTQLGLIEQQATETESTRSDSTGHEVAESGPAEAVESHGEGVSTARDGELESAEARSALIEGSEPETPAAEPTGIEQADARAGAAEARPEFPPSPRS